MYSLILIERDPFSYKSWPSLNKKKQIPTLSVEDIVSKYKGFEGDLICFFNINENLTDINKMTKDYLKLKELGNCFVLHIISMPNSLPDFLKKQTIKLGYDVGVCEEEKTIYSSIFHEILFGYFDELISYKDFLNDNFLFPDRSIAEEYVKLHDEMSAQGKDVEDYEKMTIYEIWEHLE